MFQPNPKRSERLEDDIIVGSHSLLFSITISCSPLPYRAVWCCVRLRKCAGFIYGNVGERAAVHLVSRPLFTDFSSDVFVQICSRETRQEGAAEARHSTARRQRGDVEVSSLHNDESFCRNPVSTIDEFFCGDTVFSSFLLLLFPPSLHLFPLFLRSVSTKWV